jgi:DNA-binding NarL/FixJ family response regulator
MTRVFLAIAKTEERSALQLLLQDLQMEVVGKAMDWAATQAMVSMSQADILLVDFDILPADSRNILQELRISCPNAKIILLVSLLNARKEAVLSAGADGYISNGESPERVAEQLVEIARKKM